MLSPGDLRSTLEIPASVTDARLTELESQAVGELEEKTGAYWGPAGQVTFVGRPLDTVLTLPLVAESVDAIESWNDTAKSWDPVDLADVKFTGCEIWLDYHQQRRHRVTVTVQSQETHPLARQWVSRRVAQLLAPAAVESIKGGVGSAKIRHEEPVPAELETGLWIMDVER